MYKKMNRVIEKRRIPFESRDSSFFLLPIMRRYVNFTCMFINYLIRDM